jgi:hypothetical protein
MVVFHLRAADCEARFAYGFAPLAIGDDAHHFVKNVRPNPNFPI